MIIHSGAGISGCNIQLIENSIVRKVSPSIEYNDRLKSQMEKQLYFNMPISVDITVPNVLANGYINDLFYFDMEYINGVLFNEMFHRISIKELDEYFQILRRYLNRPNYLYYDKIELENIIVNKLLSLKSKSQYKKLIKWVLNNIHIEKTLVKGYCHGDLTFSNILFLPGQFCFLDFLDSYIESPIMDFVKLKQDLYYGWYLNFLPMDEIYLARSKQIFKYMWKRIEEEWSEIINTELFHILDVINYLRIEPYITTTLQANVLNKIIGETVIYAKFNSSNGRKLQ